MISVGVDGAEGGGWLAVIVADETARVASGDTLEAIVSEVGRSAVIGVDIPIGFPEPSGGPRRADTEARRMLGRQGSSVFTVYPRAVYEAGSYEEAKRLARELVNAEKGLSKQAFAIGDRILEADSILARGARLFEVHPEVSFRKLAGRALVSKHSADGLAERRRVLERAGIPLPEGRATNRDLLDAGVAAWSARRIAAGTARTIPPRPWRDEPVIWY